MTQEQSTAIMQRDLFHRNSQPERSNRLYPLSDDVDNLPELVLDGHITHNQKIIRLNTYYDKEREEQLYRITTRLDPDHPLYKKKD